VTDDSLIEEEDEQAPDPGVKQVGGSDEASAEESRIARRAKQAKIKPRNGPKNERPPVGPQDRLIRVLAVVATLALVGTAVFAVLFFTKSSGDSGEQAAVQSASKAFLVDFFNFNAKSIDTDFNAVTAMATGSFSSQANEFFNSAIRKELEASLAESRGQIRYNLVQSLSPHSASVYAVVDQVYVNDKITTPASDVVRLIVNLTEVGSTWKISDVTVLEGATPASAGSTSGSAGSDVPGQ
jgi:hypothetical protein